MCEHNFCRAHRATWGPWVGLWEGTMQVVRGLWQRGQAAVSQWLKDNPPRFCDGHDRERVDEHASL